MALPGRVLTNDYHACRLIKLDASDPQSPLVVMQEGYDSADPQCTVRMYYLQRDGFWIDEIARSTRPDTEAGDIVFDTSAEAMQALSGLVGKPLIRHLPVTEADTQAYMARAKGGNSQELFRQFLARYRAAQAKG